MSFAQEIRDFTTAFKAMNDALGDPLDRASKQADIDWKNAQRDKWRWDMGAEDRERQDILSFGSTSDIPWGTQPTFKPTSMTGDQSSFVTSMQPLAQKVADATGLDPSLVLAQSALETGWGKSAPGNNYFGIKGKGQTHATTESIGGQMVNTSDSFRAYNSPEESFADYVNFISDDRYAGVRSGKNLVEQARALQTAGYATDPDYANKLIQIANSIKSTNPASGLPADFQHTATGNEASYTGPVPSQHGYHDISNLARIGDSDRAAGVGNTMSQPRGLVIHHTGGRGTAEDVMTTLNDRGFSVQYVIDRDGQIYQTLPEGARGQHIRNGPNGQSNDNMFGVEVIANDDSDVTPQQVEAARRLAGDLGSRYGFDTNSVFGHGEINPHKQATEGSTIVNAIRGGGPIPTTQVASAPTGGGTAELPGTEAVSTTGPAAGADIAAAGVTPTARAAGIDPFSQTSGHMDAVSQAGNENMNPAAAERVARGEGSNVHIRTLLQSVFGGMKKRMGGTSEAVATGPNKIDQAVMSGAGAAPPGLVQQMEAAIDPKGELPEGTRHIRALKKIYDYYRMAGKPEKAEAATYAIAQTYRGMANQMLGIAQNAAEEGDIEGAIQAFQEAYSLVPDGESLNVEPREDGTFKVDTIDDETGKVTTSRVMSARDIMSQIMQITPAEFDAMILKPATGVGGAGEGTANAITEYEELMGDEAISEGAPPDAEVTPDVPDATPLPHPGQTTAPMGTTTIPADAAGVRTAGGVQVASLDPDAGVSVEDPDEVIREEAVAETATGGDEEETEAVSTAPTGGVTPPFATNPGLRVKQVDELTTRLRREGREADAQLVEARFDRDIKIWNEYVKSMKTAEDRAVVDQFYSALGATPEGQRFDIPQDLFRSITNPSLQRSMQLAADAHNAAAEKLGDESALQLSAQALQSLTEQYIPSQAIKGVEGPESGTPGPLGFMFDAAWGAPTEIEGGVAQPGEMVDWPRLTEEDPRVLLLNKADRDAFEGRIKDYNAATTTQNKAWGPGEPLSLTDMETADRLLDEADTAAQNAITNNPDPAVKAASTEHYTNIKNLGHISNVKGAAQTMLTMPRDLNPGMNPEVAFNSALAFAMPNPADPRRADYQGIRVKPSDGVPAGLVRIVDRSDGSTIAVLPEQTFRDLDRIRIQMAEAYIRKHEGAAMTAATGAAADADLAATTQQRIEQQQRDEAMGGLGTGLGMPEPALTAPSLQELEMQNR